MNVWANLVMTKVLNDNNYNFLASSTEIPNELLKILDSGFRDEQNCILFKDFEYFGPGALTSDYAKASYECFLNYINLNGYMTETTFDFELLKVGLEFSKRLFQRLHDLYPYNFRIIVSYEVSGVNELEASKSMECIIKFHRIRQDTDGKVRLDSLQLVTDGGVMFLE